MTNGVVATIAVGWPVGLAYDGGTGEIFVWNEVSNEVTIISDSTNAVMATVSVGSFPVGVAYDAQKGEIFVANSGANTVSVISDVNRGVIANIHVGSEPVGIF